MFIEMQIKAPPSEPHLWRGQKCAARSCPLSFFRAGTSKKTWPWRRAQDNQNLESALDILLGMTTAGRRQIPQTVFVIAPLLHDTSDGLEAKPSS
jgi:hypothetical protein